MYYIWQVERILEMKSKRAYQIIDSPLDLGRCVPPQRSDTFLVTLQGQRAFNMSTVYYSTLFDSPPIARNSDPATSHRAAEEITSDGTRSRMMQVALDAVRRHPGRTSNELEAITGHGDGKIRKRLADLEKDGLVRKGEVRKSEVSGKNCHVWLLVEEA